MSGVSKESGTALITVLLIFFVASYITAEMFNRLDRDVRRSTTLLAQDQAYIYAVSAEEMAIRILKQDLKDDKERDEPKKPLDTLEEDWHNEVWFPLEGGGIKANLSDLQSRFNVNDLRNNILDARQRFLKLLTDLNIPEEGDRLALVDSVVEWMDADDIPKGNGAEDVYYLGLEKPYRTSNSFMESPTELNLVKGMTAADYWKLKPFICALPENTLANINTIDQQVLSIYKGVSDASGIIEKRGDKGYLTPAEAFKGVKKENAENEDKDGENKDKDDEAKGVDLNAFSVHSEFFLLETTATVSDRSVHLNSIIYRPIEPSETNPIRVISRSRARSLKPLVRKREIE